MGSMSASDAAPLPRLGEVFFDVRGSSRSMRLSWYSDTGVAVFSIWQGGTCTGTFRLPIDDLPRMVEALQRGPRGAALPAADGPLSGDRPRRGIAGVPADPAATSAGGFPEYATGQHIAPVTGEFRSFGPGDPAARSLGYGDADRRNTGLSLPGADSRGGAPSRYGEPSYRDDPLGSGSYPAYQEDPGASFPGFADDGPPPPPAYPPPPSYRDDPLGGGYQDHLSGPQNPPPPSQLGPGGYQNHPSGPQHPLDGPSPLGPGSGYREESRPGYRDSAYAGDPLGSGSYPAYQEDPGASFPGFADDGPPPPPAYPPPPSYRDDPLGGGYQDHPSGPQNPPPPSQLGPGGYQNHPSGPQHPLDVPSPLGPGSGYREESRPGYRDSAYAGDPLGSGSYPAHRDRDPYPPSAPDEPGTYPEDRRGQRYADDPFQSVYPDAPPGPAGYPDDTRGGSHPYDLPPERPEQRAPRGRS